MPRSPRFSAAMDALLFGRRHTYQMTFGTPEGRAVLKDLMKFCGVSEAVIVPDDQLSTGFNDGKRRVALRIAKFLNMSDEEILRLAQAAGEEE